MSLIGEIIERGARYAEDGFRTLQESEAASIVVDFITALHPALKVTFLCLILLAIGLLAIRHRSKKGFLKFIRELSIGLLIVVCIVMMIALIAHLKTSLSR